MTNITEDQLIEIRTVLTDLKGGWAEIKALPRLFKTLQEESTDVKSGLAKLKKEVLTLTHRSPRPIRKHEVVTHDCAEYVASIAYIGAERFNKLSHLNSQSRELILNKSAEVLGMELRTALTTTDIPLPIEYQSQVVELVWMYGDFRRNATGFPMGTGTVKLPKLKTSPAFGLIALSGNVSEKSPQVSFVTFSAEKSGGIVRIPSEIDADSIASVGQFVARYGAREMAKWEDTWGFLADGSGTYDSKSGVCKTADTLTFKIQLTAGNGKPSNITLQNLRDLRAKIDQAAYNNAAYYMNRTMEGLLCSYNSATNATPYIANGPNGPTLDGFPVRWVGVLPVYDNASNHFNQYQAVFGDLSYWYLGERGSMRVDVSNDIYFATDEVGIRFLERFDPELMADQSNAVLQLSAS
ncbi:MAG TPA: phage major capsid protein [Candidatus Dormibacteraeota bacterium]|nr:phage major capsid protein [Candidatus Dormibacteraeota bacterium]